MIHIGVKRWLPDLARRRLSSSDVTCELWTTPTRGPCPLRPRLTCGPWGHVSCTLCGPLPPLDLNGPHTGRLLCCLHSALIAFCSPLVTCARENTAAAGGHRHRFHFTLYPLLPCVLCAGGAVATAHAPLSPSVPSPSRVLTLCLSYYLFLCFLLLPHWQNFSESVDPAIIYRKCQDMFALRTNLMNDNIFLPRSLRLGFLFFVFLRSLFFLLFLFCFCCRLVDSLVQNPLLMPDLFSLRVDLMNGDIFCVLSLLPLFHFFSFTLSCCKFHSCRWARVLTLGLFFVLSLLAFLFYFLLPPHWLLGA
jgi:hypothetical protein